MIRRAALLTSVLLVLACKRDQATTPPDDATDDASATQAEDETTDEEAEPEGSKRPVPVQQVLKIEGKLPETAIDAMLQERLNEIRTCFDDALQHPDGVELKGAVVVTFTVGKDGKPAGAKLELSELGYAPTESCLVGVVETFSFPKQKAESTVHLPFYMNTF